MRTFAKKTIFIILVVGILGVILCFLLNGRNNIETEVTEQLPASGQVSGSEVVTDESEMALKAYEEFLLGKRSVNVESKYIDKIDINYISIPTGESERRYDTKYTYFDVNGDNVPELHVNSARYYYVFSYQNGAMYEWKDLSPYPYYYPLNNGAFISCKIGAAPLHRYYTYYVYDFYGKEISNIGFYKIDSNENGIYDENDEYNFEGVEVTKQIWEALTSKYIDADGNIRQDLMNEIEWTVMFEGNVSDNTYVFHDIEQADSSISEEVKNFLDKYSALSIKEDAKRMALIYLDGDSIPELVLLKDGEYSESATIN